MEVVAARSDLIDDVPTQAAAMLAAFHPLLEAREIEINSFKTKTFAYGPTDRHKLDVYFPNPSGVKSVPILFFVYGGGYAQGAKAMGPPYHLIHRNVGAFFASQGFVTVIADYRLIPHIKFPDPATDLKDAAAFVVQHAQEINADVDVKGDTERIFFMGHSAGAAIVTTMVLIPDFIPDDMRRRIQGLVLLGGAYHFRNGPAPPPIAVYYETEDGIRQNEPLALLERAPTKLVSGLPPTLMLVSEKEPKGLVAVNEDFRDLLGGRLGVDIPILIMKGHNHTSVAFGLFSGVGEEWAYEVASWVKHQPTTRSQIRSKV
ncbi:Alpha/Beta hydrolase protein [Cytidiella melzeri]|nr:Alpha/Beta hydrolase protein [Cytidiella melzeri]